MATSHAAATLLYPSTAHLCLRECAKKNRLHDVNCLVLEAQCMNNNTHLSLHPENHSIWFNIFHGKPDILQASHSYNRGWVTGGGTIIDETGIRPEVSWLSLQPSRPCTVLSQSNPYLYL